LIGSGGYPYYGIMKIPKILLYLLFAAPGILAAHPHMGFTAAMEFEFSGDKMKGVWQEWRFDPFFSGSIRGSYDWNGDGRFDLDETEAVFAGAFANLKNYDFFIFYRTGGKTLVPERVERFSVWMEGNTMVYRFFVPLEVKDREIFLSVFDRTYFCAITYADPPAVTSGTTNLAPQYRRRENRDNPVYYNPLSPADDNTRYDRWAPGLETAYPEELHVTF